MDGRALVGRIEGRALLGSHGRAVSRGGLSVAQLLARAHRHPFWSAAQEPVCARGGSRVNKGWIKGVDAVVPMRKA